jgi:hypothetical protein
MYLINTEKLKVIGRFPSEAAAEKVADRVKQNTHLVDSPKHLDAFNGTELCSLYNALTGAELKRFSTKADGIKRLWAEMQEMPDAKEAARTRAKSTRAAGSVRATNGMESRKMKLLAAANKKTFHEGSLRGKCFDIIEDGMAVTEYLKRCKRRGIERSQAMGCLSKLVDTVGQKYPTVKLV